MFWTADAQEKNCSFTITKPPSFFRKLISTKVLCQH